MKSKIILLIIGMLFLCLNIEIDSKEIKQNDSITKVFVDNNHVVSSTNYSSVNDLVFSTIYPQYIENTNYRNTTCISNSNHFAKVSEELSLNTDFNRNKYINIFEQNNSNTRYIRSKTLGLVGLNKNVYFNLYLYHYINKLGCT